MKDYVDELTKARKEKVEKDRQFEEDIYVQISLKDK